MDGYLDPRFKSKRRAFSNRKHTWRVRQSYHRFIAIASDMLENAIRASKAVLLSNLGIIRRIYLRPSMVSLKDKRKR